MGQADVLEILAKNKKRWMDSIEIFKRSKANKSSVTKSLSRLRIGKQVLYRPHPRFSHAFEYKYKT